MKLLLPLVAALAVVLVACGGGGDNEASPTASTSAAGEPAATAAAASATAPAASATAPAASATAPAATAAATVENQAEVEALLKAAALRPEDLPEGYTLDEEKFTTNEESVAETAGPGEATLEDLNGFGRILGYEASYSQEAGLSTLLEGGTLFLQTTTTVYQDSDGAKEHFGFVRDQASDPEFVDNFEKSFADSPGVEVSNASISEISVADVGDERLGYEVKVSAHSTDLDQDFDFVGQIIGVRRDRMIGAITVVSINSSTPTGQLEDLARTMDQRMKDALE
jgi:hypothetical protein